LFREGEQRFQALYCALIRHLMLQTLLPPNTAPQPLLEAVACTQ
jgi:hypothetical protein